MPLSFLIEAKVILEGDGRERLVFLADVDAFFGFDRLMQPVAPAAARHQAASEGIDNNDFAVLDHIVHVAFVERVGLDPRLDVVLQIPVFRVGNVVDAKSFLNRDPAIVGDADGPVLFIDDIIAGEILFAFAQLDAKLVPAACDRAIRPLRRAGAWE